MGATKQLLWAIVAKSVVFMGEDNAAFDMTIQSAVRWNEVTVGTSPPLSAVSRGRVVE